MSKAFKEINKKEYPSVRGMFNTAIKTKHFETQVDSHLLYAINNPKPMSQKEMNKAELAGLNVNRSKGFVE